jgi:hypothetical protein
MMEMNLYEVCCSVQKLEVAVTALPPMQEVLDAMDAKELDDDRNGRSIPREALKHLRPIFVAALEFQKACLASQAAYRGGKGRS